MADELNPIIKTALDRLGQPKKKPEATPATSKLDTSKYKLPDNDPNADKSRWAKRADGSEKGMGFLGLLKRPDGSVSSEISIGVTIDGKEVEIPTMVPTLTQQELDYLLNNPAKQGHPIPESIIKKAYEHARQRMSQGLSPFAQPGETQ